MSIEALRKLMDLEFATGSLEAFLNALNMVNPAEFISLILQANLHQIKIDWINYTVQTRTVELEHHIQTLLADKKQVIEPLALVQHYKGKVSIRLRCPGIEIMLKGKHEIREKDKMVIQGPLQKTTIEISKSKHQTIGHWMSILANVVEFSSLERSLDPKILFSLLHVLVERIDEEPSVTDKLTLSVLLNPDSIININPGLMDKLQVYSSKIDLKLIPAKLFDDILKTLQDLQFIRIADIEEKLSDFIQQEEFPLLVIIRVIYQLFSFSIFMITDIELEGKSYY